MKIHDLPQGSPEWLAYRAQHFNASDAPAMMGCSPYKTRAQLLRELHTGIAAEVDAGQQKRFDNGHRAEALARPLAEKIIGEDFYPVTGSEGRLSASFDGLTMDERQGFEHKALNAELKAAFDAMHAEHFREVGEDAAGCRLLPIYHRVQMEQQLHISGAERILFMASEWTADGELVEERHCWYYPDAELRAQILRGWDQFAADLAAYVLPAAAEPAPVGKAPDLLPALRIEVTGQVTASNLAEFKATALATIRAVNRTLKTDQDFADADKAVKWCADVESRLKAAKEHALSQTADIEALFRALDEIGAEAKTVRLDLDKLVTKRKTEVKEEAVAKARRALDEHVASLNAEIAPMRITVGPVDFAGAIKGLRSIASMQDALDTALAGAKIGAGSAARLVRGNVATFQAEAAGFEFLFADLGALVHKAADDFRALVTARIATHKAAEDARAKAKAEAEAKAAAETPAPAPAAPAPIAAAAPAPMTSRGGSGGSLKRRTYFEPMKLTTLFGFPADVTVTAGPDGVVTLSGAVRLGCAADADEFKRRMGQLMQSAEATA
ncbi:COG5377 Phage-related protein, predicted endonuclease [uncultured Caudovirales phage]|uniref:COG5377 Phage-related protein, predicted endonuclease n=1 Tax=uncultured Caudovirales phage TaxID=2100421 RepID=A0A6J5NKA5_9CAUD|nr:COG5377 Phage-related protein, predicted endonuclease [uncultured Caudovirales phage]